MKSQRLQVGNMLGCNVHSLCGHGHRKEVESIDYDDDDDVVRLWNVPLGEIARARALAGSPHSAAQRSVTTNETK